METINIIKAYDLMKKIADQVNEEKRKAENIQVMEELRGSVQNWGVPTISLIALNRWGIPLIALSLSSFMARFR